MATDAMDDEYFVYDYRLASFTKPQAVTAKQRRASNASTHSSRAPKALSWPHKSIKPADMAKAGFVFQPLPSNPDNVTCFLCNKALDGWEQDDSPLEEHLKHSPECGWAITAAVEAELGGYAAEDPRDPLMVEARKATFGESWPHESKKGWSCKTKQLVEAGWKYTPLSEGDDNATCAYCQLALDGWEKNDKPWDEHYNRAPNCPFFSLISSKPAPKKAGRSKAARSSKASRLSLQSTATAASDMTSLADITADIDDSVLTTASNMTTASKASKKTAKAKKATTTRTRKTRAKKDEAVEVHEDEPEQDENMTYSPPPKSTRGRKRTSDEMEDSVLTIAEAPPPKTRGTKTRKARGSAATEVSQADAEMPDEPEPVKKAGARKTRKASGTRKPSARSTRKASISTTASAASPPPQIPDDDEIDRQLQADLERPLGEDDEDVLADADPETKKAASSRKTEDSNEAASQAELLAHTSTADFAMFDPTPAQPTDEQIEADLQSMKDEMDVEQPQEPELEEIKVPKKGRKAATRKVSKQATTKKAKEVAAPVVEPTKSRMTAEAEEPDEIAEADVSFASSGTVARKSLDRASLGSVTSTAASKPPAKRGRPPKKKVSEVVAEQPAAFAAVAAEPVVEPTPEDIDVEEVTPVPGPAEATKKRASTGKRGRPPKKPQASDVSSEEPTIIQASAEPNPEFIQTEVETKTASIQEHFSAVVPSPKVTRKPVPVPKDSPSALQQKAVSLAPVPAPELLAPPKTPRHLASPTQSAKQATISPSPSPQASDAENRPPSSKPGTTSSKTTRMPLGELAVATPVRQVSVSPSKRQQNQQRNIIGGLQSTEQWTAADLNLIFEQYYNGDQENAGPNGGLVDRFFAKGGELTEHERGMTVEEWIYYNAGQAEQKLKFECESMVMEFESQGTQAMRVLEGLVVE